MKPMKIADKVYYIGPDEYESSHVSAGILINSSPKIYIDIYIGEDETVKLLAEEKPDIAFLSHHHIDHTRFLPLIKEYSNAELIVPEGEENYLTDFNFFEKKTAGQSYSSTEKWNLYFKKLSNYKPVTNFKIQADGDKFKSGNVTLECIKAAGHSPSHTVFNFPSEKILFASDIGIGGFGPWYGWLDCNLTDYIESILMLKSLDIDMLITSHDGFFVKDIKHEWDKCLRHFFKREQFVKESLNKGKTKDEIIAQGIYFLNKSKVPDPMNYIITLWDSIMFDHHKNQLENKPLEKLFPELSSRLLSM